MATKISFANREIQKLEMIRFLITKQLEAVDAAIESAELERVDLDTEAEFYAHCAQIDAAQNQLNAAFIM